MARIIHEDVLNVLIANPQLALTYLKKGGVLSLINNVNQ